MERFSGFKKGGMSSARAAGATDQRNAASGKGKFKLRTTKDPLPLFTKKPSSRETKPKAKFLQLAGASASTDKPSTKPSTFATNSFIQPLTAGSPPKKSEGFSFMNLGKKPGNLGKVASEKPSGKAAFANTKPLFGKFSVNGLAKKPSFTGEVGTRTTKEQPFKLQGALPFAFRADTKASAAKKRKAAVTSAEVKNTYPSKFGRTEGRSGFAFMTHSKKKGAETAAETSGDRPNVSLIKKKGGAAMSASDGAALKKRGLVLSAAVEEPVPKRSKHTAQTVVIQQRENDSLVNITNNLRSDNRDDNILDESPAVPRDPKTITASPFGIDAMQSSAILPASPEEDCISGYENDLAVKQLCTLDDDKEYDFLTRTAAIQDFTDRVEFEQKQLCDRLLCAHVDVSESLLDALTDLMAEEGGIGIDKLDVNINLDVDVDDAFIQEPIQALQ